MAAGSGGPPAPSPPVPDTPSTSPPAGESTNAYLTEEGRDGFNSSESNTLRDAVRYLHDVLLRASHEKLDVYMLTGALPEKLFDVYYKDVTGETLAASVRRVLTTGHDVSMFLWDEPGPAIVSPGISQLAAESRSLKGDLSIHWSGTRDGHDVLAYFIIAADEKRAPPRWICQVTSPQGRHTADIDTSDEGIGMPALTKFSSKQALDLSADHLLNLFRSFQAAASESDGDRNPISQ